MTWRRLLLTRVHDRIRSKHSSFQAEKAYLQWIRRYVEFSDFRAAEELTPRDIERFLTMLAVERKVSTEPPPI